MRKPKSTEEVIQHKKKAIRKLNQLLEDYISSGNQDSLKKVDLLSYWIEEYASYIQYEKTFDYKRLKSYKRGDIIKVNFGFNVGSEYGGLHYAIVLNNNNARNSPVVTVIPLTSFIDGDELHNDDVFLGNEIYKSLKLKYDTISQMLAKEKEEQDEYVAAIELLKEMYQKTLGGENEEKYKKALDKISRAFEEKRKKNEYDTLQFEKIGKEITNMKNGSVALINLTTTISKMKIYDPKTSKGVLSGIRLTEESMEKINTKVKEFFIFDK